MLTDPRPRKETTMITTMRRLTMTAAMTVLVTLGLTSPALAQKKGKTTDLGEITIVGRVQKPIAAVDITRLAPKLTLSDLRQPFLDRIEQALTTAPF